MNQQKTTKRTKKKWREPKEYTRKGWRCDICGSRSSNLYRVEVDILEHVRCRVCEFPYSLKLPPEGSKKRYVPKPALRKPWQLVWRRAYVFFSSGISARKFMERFDTHHAANNTMNRLDGGRLNADNDLEPISTNNPYKG